MMRIVAVISLLTTACATQGEDDCDDIVETMCDFKVKCGTYDAVAECREDWAPRCEPIESSHIEFQTCLEEASNGWGDRECGSGYPESCRFWFTYVD